MAETAGWNDDGGSLERGTPLGELDGNALAGLQVVRDTPEGLRTPAAGACPGTPPPWRVAGAGGDVGSDAEDGFASFTHQFEDALRRVGLESGSGSGREEVEGEGWVDASAAAVVTPSALERREAVVRARNTVKELRAMSALDKAERRAREAEERARSTEGRAEEAEERAQEAEERAQEAEDRVQEAEERVREAGERVKEAEEVARLERSTRELVEERLRHAQVQWEWCAQEVERAGERERAVGDEAREAAARAREAAEAGRVEGERAREAAEAKVKALEATLREVEGAHAALLARAGSEDTRLSLGATKVGLRDAQARAARLEEELRQAHAKALAAEMELGKTRALVMGQVDRWGEQRRTLQARVDATEKLAEHLRGELELAREGQQSSSRSRSRGDRGKGRADMPAPLLSPGVAESTSKPLEARGGASAPHSRADGGQQSTVDRWRRRAERLRRQRDLALREAERANRHLASARAYFLTKTDMPYEELPGACTTPGWAKRGPSTPNEGPGDRPPHTEEGMSSISSGGVRQPSLTPSLDPLIDLSGP